MTLGRRVVVLGVVGGLVVLLLWWFILWSPQRKKVSDAKDRREAAEQQVSQLKVTLSRLQELKRTEALKRSQIEQLRVAVPDQPNLAQFILDANEAANRAGIDFLSITPSPPTAASGASPGSVALAMSITGGYFQVLDFVNRLTDLPRIVVIDNLSLTRGAGAEGAGSSGLTLSVAIQGRMFTTSASPGAVAPTPTTVAGGATTTTTAAGAATTSTGAP